MVNSTICSIGTSCSTGLLKPRAGQQTFDDLILISLRRAVVDTRIPVAYDINSGDLNLAFINSHSRQTKNGAGASATGMCGRFLGNELGGANFASSTMYVGGANFVSSTMFSG